MSQEAFAGLGPGLRVLTVRGNQLQELPDFSRFTGLEVVDLQDNPLMCDCQLLPLRRSVWSLTLNLRITKYLMRYEKESVAVGEEDYHMHYNFLCLYLLGG